MHVITNFFFLSSAWAVTSQDVQLCPDDWFDANSLGCFKFLDAKVNISWVEAQLECEKVGGYLAEPRAESQFQFLSELAALEGSFTGIGFWYIGLTDLGRESDWLWVHNDEAVSYTSWATNHPSNRTKNSEDCVVMVLKNNQVWWEDHSCLAPNVQHHMVAPVCQQDTSATETQTTTEQPETTTEFLCPEHWSAFNGSCFKYSSDSTTWSNADNLCLQEGGRLASVHSREEDRFLQSLGVGGTFWLGGYPSGNHGWVWSDGTDFDYYNSYDADTAYCLYQQYNYFSVGWSSTSCSSSSYSFNYTCKLLN